ERPPGIPAAAAPPTYEPDPRHRSAAPPSRRRGTALTLAPAQSLSGPGSSSAPPLPAEPNFGAVNLPVVVRGGFASSFRLAAGVCASPSASSGVRSEEHTSEL